MANPFQQRNRCTGPQCGQQQLSLPSASYSPWPPPGRAVHPSAHMPHRSRSYRERPYCPPVPGTVRGARYYSQQPAAPARVPMKPATASQVKSALGVTSEAATLSELKEKLGSSFQITEKDGKITISYRAASDASLQVGWLSQSEYSRSSFNPNGHNMMMKLPGFASSTSQAMQGSYKATLERVDIGDGATAVQHTITFSQKDLTHVRLDVGGEKMLLDVRDLLDEPAMDEAPQKKPLEIPDEAPSTRRRGL